MDQEVWERHNSHLNTLAGTDSTIHQFFGLMQIGRTRL